MIYCANGNIVNVEKISSFTTCSAIYHRGGEGVNHVKRDWLEIFNVNCDLYIFFCVKRDWGYLRET